MAIDIADNIRTALPEGVKPGDTIADLFPLLRRAKEISAFRLNPLPTDLRKRLSEIPVDSDALTIDEWAVIHVTNPNCAESIARLKQALSSGAKNFDIFAGIIDRNIRTINSVINRYDRLFLSAVNLTTIPDLPPLVDELSRILDCRFNVCFLNILPIPKIPTLGGELDFPNDSLRAFKFGFQSKISQAWRNLIDNFKDNFCETITKSDAQIVCMVGQEPSLITTQEVQRYILSKILLVAVGVLGSVQLFGIPSPIITLLSEFEKKVKAVNDTLAKIEKRIQEFNEKIDAINDKIPRCIKAIF